MFPYDGSLLHNAIKSVGAILRLPRFVRISVSFLLAGLLLCTIFWLMAAVAGAQSSTFSVIKLAPSQVKAGETFTYTIRVLNSSSLSLNVDVTDPIPSNVTVVDPGSGTLSGGAIKWSGLLVGPVSFVEVKFKVVVTEAGDMVNADYQATSGSTTEFGVPVTTTILANDPAILTISADPDSTTVNGSSILTITVTDIYGNPVTDNTSVSIDFDKGTIDSQAAGSTVSGMTSGGQVIKTLMVGTVAGMAHITATAGSAVGTTGMVIAPGPPTSLAVTALPTSISTVGNEFATITAIVTDQYGNPMAQTPVTITTSLGSLNDSGSTVTVSTSQGQAQATLAGTVAGTVNLTVKVGSLVDTSQSVYLTSGPPTDLIFQANPNAIVADGVSTSTITLRIFDQHNNLVDQSVPVTITTSLGDFTTGGTTYTETTTDGEVQVVLKSITRTGLANVQVSAAGLNSDTGVNFVSGPPAKISLDIDPTTIPADGTSTSALTATVRDTFDNLVSTLVTVTFASGGGTFIGDPVGATTDGIIVRSLRSSTILGTVPVTVSTPGAVTPAIGSIEFVVGPPSSADVSLNPTSPITAGVPVTLTLTIRDNVGHVISGAPITVTSSLGTISPSPTGTTNGSGQLQRTLVSTQAGLAPIGVSSANRVLNVNGGSISFVPDAAVQATLTANPTQIVADGNATAQITAILKDRYGNPVPNVTPNFTISPMLGSLIGSSATNASGITTRTLQSTTQLGLAFISISDLLTVTNAAVNFVTGPPASATLAANPLTTQVGQNVTMVITVTDSVGHPIAGQTLAVTSTFGTVSGCGATNSEGVTTCILNSTQSGQPQIYVAGILATGDVITFNPGDLHHIHVTPFGPSSSTPLDASAGVALDFEAVGHDIYHNLITGLSFVWSKDNLGGDGAINASTGVFVGTTGGLVRVKASTGGKTGVSYVDVGPGTPAIGLIDANPLEVPANGADISSLSIYVTDAFGNPVGFGVPLTVTTSIGAVQGTSTTNSNSTAFRTIQSTQAGVAIIGVTNLITLAGDTVITFTPGAPAKVVVAAAPVSLPANGLAQSTLNITLLDSFDNPVESGYNPTVQSSLGTVSGTGSTNATGTIVRTLTAPAVAGTANFIVKYLGVPLSVLGDTVEFVVGPLAQVETDPSGSLSLTAGQPTVFTAQGYDADNAPIPGDLNYGWDLTCTGPGCGELDTLFGQQATFTGTSAGTGVQLTASADENGAFYDTIVNITVLPAPPILATVVANPSAVIANGTSSITLTLTDLVDGFGNPPADGEVITVTVQSAPEVRTKTAVVTGEQAEVVISSTTQAGTYAVSAFSAAGEMVLSGDTSLTFVPGPPAEAELLSTTPSEIVADGMSTSTLVLQLRDEFGNKVASGLIPVVTTTLGAIVPGGDSTGSNGLLTRTLRAGLVLGNALISVDGFVASGPPVSLIPGPPFSADSTVITSTLAAGGESTPIIFEVRDAWNHGVADGTIITPTMTPAYGTFSGLVQTVGGLITPTLTSGTSVGTAIVGSEGISVTGDTLITFVPGPAAVAHIAADPASLAVAETTALVITVTDAYNNVVPPTAITLTATLGTLDGIGSTVSKTTATGTGIISASLSSTVAGTETLALKGPAGSLTIHPASDDIVFLPDEPLVVTLEPSGSVTATAGVTLTVTASSRDSYGNAVDPWTPVNYTWQQSATVDGPGYGTINTIGLHARSINFMPMKVGANQLWATGGVTTSDVLTVNVTSGPPATATITVNPGSVPADGVSTYTITLTNIVDAFGNPIPDGTPLTVTVQSSPPVVGVGTTLGGTMVGLLSSNTRAGTHAIIVEGGGGPLTLSGDTSVTFTPGPPAQAIVDATPETVPGDGMSTASLVITVYDAHANLIADGIPITVTASLGTLTGGGVSVDGQVERALRAPLGLGTASFTVAGPNGSLFVLGDTVEFVPGPPVFASVTATPVQVLADGTSTSLITITIKDGQGFTTGGSGAALLSVSRGSLLPTTTVASAGSFTTTFIADSSIGPVGLSVTYEGVPLQVVGDSLELVSGSAVSATILANPTSLKVGSSNQSSLTVSLFDTWGHPVADGTVVTVTTSLGSILPYTSNTTVNGFVTRTLTPGLTIGTATFTVQAMPGTGSLSVSGDSVEITPGSLDHIEIMPAGSVQVMAGNSVSFSAVGHDVFHNETGTNLFNWHKRLGSGNGSLSSNGVFTATLAGTVGVQASQGTVFSPIKTVTILPGPPITAVVSANPITIPVGGVATELTITARDAYGNLVADGTSLNVVSDLGTLIGSGVTHNGVLTRTLLSGDFYGTVDIFVNDWEAGGDKPVFVPRAQVTANPSSLFADGVSQTVLTIKVFDVTGQPVPDGTWPVITTTLGTLTGSGSTIGGVFTRTLGASALPGVAQIYVNGTLAEGEVPFNIGPAAVADIKATPTFLMADGKSKSSLTITVQDAYGHVITNAGSLTVTASHGVISGVKPTVNGVTTRMLTADSQEGTAIISVVGLSTAGDRKIHFVGESLKDGDFEDGNLENWTVGQIITPTGVSRAYSVTVLSSDKVGEIDVKPIKGNSMVRLGATTSDNTAHELSEAWLSQPIYVQSGGLTQVTFRYRLLSYDVAVGSAAYGFREWDPFEVYLNGGEVLQDGYLWSQEWQVWHGPPLPSSPKDMGWKQGVLDLTPYAGQVVIVEFRLSNRQAAIDNTWVYLDNVSMIYRESETHNVFLPVVLH